MSQTCARLPQGEVIAYTHTHTFFSVIPIYRYVCFYELSRKLDSACTGSMIPPLSKKCNYSGLMTAAALQRRTSCGTVLCGTLLWDTLVPHREDVDTKHTATPEACLLGLW